MNKLPPPNWHKDANNFRVQAEFFQSKAYPHTKLYLRWHPQHQTYVVDGYYPSGGWARQCTLKKQIDHSRAEAAGARSGRDTNAALLKALEAAIVRELGSIHSALSPECLTMDGERPQNEVEAEEKLLKAQMANLIEALGRTPSVAEVYGYGDDHPLADVSLQDDL